MLGGFNPTDILLKEKFERSKFFGPWQKYTIISWINYIFSMSSWHVNMLWSDGFVLKGSVTWIVFHFFLVRMWIPHNNHCFAQYWAKAQGIMCLMLIYLYSGLLAPKTYPTGTTSLKISVGTVGLISSYTSSCLGFRWWLGGMLSS